MALTVNASAFVEDNYKIHEKFNLPKIKQYVLQYVYGHNKASFGDITNVPLQYVYMGYAHAGNKYYLPVYESENIFLKAAYSRTILEKYVYLITAFTLYFDRRNSNIYKNIFQEHIVDLELIEYIKQNTITSINSIYQERHNFKIGDVLCFDTRDNKYHLAKAVDIEERTVAGIVSEIQSNNVFGLMTSGIIDLEVPYFDSDSSIVYLSDVLPGEMVDYNYIQSGLYLPIGIYTKDGLIVNIQQGSIGDIMLPYDDILEEDFETYEKSDLDEIIKTVLGV